MVKTGRMPRLRQKAITSAVNVWVRVPGHVLTATLLLICATHGASHIDPWYFPPIVASLTLLNGLYYGEQAVGTFHRMAALSPTYADKQAAEAQLSKAK